MKTIHMQTTHCNKIKIFFSVTPTVCRIEGLRWIKMIEQEVKEPIYEVYGDRDDKL
jgi:hypothetical protein